MKTKTLLTLTAAMALTAGSVRAAHMWEDPNGWMAGHFSYDVDAPKYTAQELSLDLFASYENPEGKFNDLFDTNIRHGFWGGGAGLNYFLTRNLGLGADFNMSAKNRKDPWGGVAGNDLDLVDHVLGDVTLRFPLGNSGVAPYFIGSGGRGFVPRDEWLYGGGVGLEIRMNPTTGIFSDARFLWADRQTEDNRLIIRAGLRLVF